MAEMNCDDIRRLLEEYNGGLDGNYSTWSRGNSPNTKRVIAFQFCMWLSRQVKSEYEWCQTSRQWLVVLVPYTKGDMEVMCRYLSGCDVSSNAMVEGRDAAILQIFGEQVALEIPSPIVDLGTPDVLGCASSYFAQTPRVSSWNEGFGEKGLVEIAEPRLPDS